MTLMAQEINDTMTVIDTDGGRWWPNEAAQEEIETSDDPEETALRLCNDHPRCGEWRS